jgi:CAAX protease family protein
MYLTILELLLLFVIVPVIVSVAPGRVPGLPLLWVATVYCLWILGHDGGFDRGSFRRLCHIRRLLPRMLIMFVAASVTLSAAVWLASPDLLFALPISSPWSWVSLLGLYILLSVVPQTIVFRIFFFYRYRALFRTESHLLLAGALAFAFVHIIFRNPVAVLATLPAGFVFGRRYLSTRSGPVSALEHALYGCMMFTVGLGGYFGLET